MFCPKSSPSHQRHSIFRIFYFGEPPLFQLFFVIGQSNWLIAKNKKVGQIHDSLFYYPFTITHLRIYLHISTIRLKLQNFSHQWTSPHDCTSPVLDGGQFIHWLWVGQLPATISFCVGLEKKVPFLFDLFFFEPVLQTYQPHSRACNPSSSSPSCIFGWPNILVSSVS
jgi:hypothetical protein